MTGTNKSQRAKAAENAIFSELGRVQDLLQSSPTESVGGDVQAPGETTDAEVFAGKPLQESPFTQHVLLELEALQQTLTNNAQPRPKATPNVKPNPAKTLRRGLKEVQTCMFEEVFGELPAPKNPLSAQVKQASAEIGEPKPDDLLHTDETCEQLGLTQESLALHPPSGQHSDASPAPVEPTKAAAPTQSPKAQEPACAPKPQRTSLFSPLHGDTPKPIQATKPAQASKPALSAKPAQSTKTTVAPTSSAPKPAPAKSLRPEQIDALVDDLVAQYLPEIEQRLRQSLKRLLDK